MFLSTLVITCAMCAGPALDVTPAAPPVVAVHTADAARGDADCDTVSAIVGTTACTTLPPIPGVDAGADGVVVTLYTDDPDQAEDDRTAINFAYQGHAITRTAARADAPPPPYRQSPGTSPVAGTTPARPGVFRAVRVA